MESLHMSFLRAVDEGLFKGVYLQGSISISHLFYEDDAMFIGEWSDANLKGIVNILKCFFLASGLCMSRHKAWADTVLKLRSRLSNWKVKTLSIGGRLTLLKSVLGASPLYNMSIFSVNISSNWCSIVRELHLLTDKGFDFLSHCKKRIGDGNGTRFWYDKWLGDKSLRDQFPRLFALELDKEALVAVKMNTSVAHSFRRPVRAGFEHQQMVDLNSLLESVSLSSSHDRWFCDLGGDGEFRVKEVYNFLDDLFLPSHFESTRWVKFIPIKINIFAWRDCLPTRASLTRRGVLLDSSNCPLCQSSEEDIQHVLFRCDLAEIILRRICRWWDLDWQVLVSFSDWQSWFSSIRLPTKVKNMLEGVFCVAW
ncbi:RNA-directed DNA polymerase, eukaryota [Tanacetum coccineum]